VEAIPRGQPSEVAGLDGLDDLLGRGVEAVLGHDGDLLARRPLRGEDAVGRLQGDIDGLLDHDVLAGLEGGHARSAWVPLGVQIETASISGSASTAW
jgi:hypothetical protein